MKINIAQWNKYKNRIADELFGEPFDWLFKRDKDDVIEIFKERLQDGSI